MDYYELRYSNAFSSVLIIPLWSGVDHLKHLVSQEHHSEKSQMTVHDRKWNSKCLLAKVL